MDSKMSPQVPAIAKTTVDEISMLVPRSLPTYRERGVLDRPERTFSATPRFLAKRPVCRSHRSDAKERSRKTVVTQQPAMKSGFKPWAPISEMKAIRWLACMES